MDDTAADDAQGGDSSHPQDLKPEKLYYETHPLLNGRPCDETGNFLNDSELPLPNVERNIHDWGSYENRLKFELSDLLFRQEEMPQDRIDHLLSLWAASLLPYGGTSPLDDHTNLHSVIDATELGDAPWSALSARYTGPLPENPPAWMTKSYEIWRRDPRVCAHNMLSNPDFAQEFDFAPYREYDSKLERRFTNLMSGNWAWKQADKHATDPECHGAMYCPFVIGSDKTTVSVATGQTDYYPLYFSPGNVWNGVRRAHRNAVVVVAFLAIPKADRESDSDPRFRLFRRQLFHSSLAAIFRPLLPKAGQPKYDIVRCPDGHWRRAIYDIGPYIADYIEQVLAGNVVQGWCAKCPTVRKILEQLWNGDVRSKEHTELLVQAFDLRTLWNEYGVVGDIIPFTNDFPHADINELIAGDLLHQVIKGCFKDHLVEWVGEYLVLTHGEAKAREIMDQIDRRIAAVPPFTGLRKFKEGRNFKQWTGDDSKGLMKVYLPAIAGFVPDDMLRAISTFMEFCYLVRRNVITESTIEQIESCIKKYHKLREVFRTYGVRPDGFSTLPREHSIDHYPQHIRNFGAPNGLCSSITESRHITAVKKPWRRSNHYEALGQMLLTNQRLDKLAAARAHFTSLGMLDGTCLSDVLAQLAQSNPEVHGTQTGRTASSTPVELDEIDSDCDTDTDDVVEGPRILGDVSLARTLERSYPRTFEALGRYIGVLQLVPLVSEFLYDQLHPDINLEDSDVTYHTLCPLVATERVRVVHSAAATFYAPSDISGVGGMRREHIRATPSWHVHGDPRYDCVFAEKDPSLPGFLGLHAARVRLLFSFISGGVEYPCALVHWFSPVCEQPDELTGMWIVEPDHNLDGSQSYGVIHLDTILRAAHLIPVFGSALLPFNFDPGYSLDAFRAYYVNKFADHHAHEVAF